MSMLLRRYHAEPDKGEVTTSEDATPEPEPKAKAKRNQSAKD